VLAKALYVDDSYTNCWRCQADRMMFRPSTRLQNMLPSRHNRRDCCQALMSTR